MCEFVMKRYFHNMKFCGVLQLYYEKKTVGEVAFGDHASVQEDCFHRNEGIQGPLLRNKIVNATWDINFMFSSL